jgi:hypothetical protein
MSVGFLMLCHTALDRAAQVARHWATQGCPVVIHVDKRVRRKGYDGIVKALADLPNVRFSGRHACETFRKCDMSISPRVPASRCAR